MKRNIAAFFDIDGTIHRNSLLIEHFKLLLKYEYINVMSWEGKVKEKFSRWENRTGDYDDYLEELVEIYVEALKNFSKADMDFLAIDVHGPGVGNLCKLIAEQNIGNIRVMRHDAVEVVENMLAESSLHGIHIFFPDPWHKKRHNKRRLIQVPFVQKLLPKLQSGGYIHLATDWEEYALQMLDVLNQFPNELQNTAADFAPTPAYRPETKFEARGKRLGHGVWDLVFRKK